MAGEIVTKSKRFYCVSIFPDICLTPIGPTMVPIPYMIVGEFSEATGVSANIKSNGEPVVIHASTVIPRVYGDEAGIGKGIKSETVGGRVQPMEKSSSLSFNGERAVRVGDLVYMNDKNTIGKVFERLPTPTAAELAAAGKPCNALEALAQLISDPGAATKVIEYIPSDLVNLVPGTPFLASALNTATNAVSRLLADLGVTTQRESAEVRADDLRKPTAVAAKDTSASNDGGRSRGIARAVPIPQAPPDNSSILRANDRATMPWLYEESQPTRIEMIMSAEALKFGSYYERVSGLSFGIPVDNDGFMFSNTYPVTPGVGVAFTNVFEWDGKSPMVTKYGMFTADRNAEGGYYFREATEDEASVMLGTHRAEAADYAKKSVVAGAVGYVAGVGSTGVMSAISRRTIVPPNPRIFITNDPGVADLISAIESKFPGKVKQAEIKLYRPDGRTFTDFDVVTDTHVIQVKVGTGKGIVDQIQKSQELTNLEVIGFDAGKLLGKSSSFKEHIMKDARHKEVFITNDIESLLKKIGPVKPSGE